MNKKEALAKIEELKKYIESLDKEVGFEDDEIFLLSIEEYEKYEDVISKMNIWWWLRSPGYDTYYAAFVNNYGYVNRLGYYVDYYNLGVCPAIKLYNFSPTGFEVGKENPEAYYALNFKIGDEFIYQNRPFTIIDENLAIASIPITFDKFDDNSNDYKNSYIRKWLLDWYEGEI